jgi:hypothetical protein
MEGCIENRKWKWEYHCWGASSPHQPTQEPPKQIPWMLSKMKTSQPASDRKEICPQFKRAYDQGWLEKKDAHDKQLSPLSQVHFHRKTEPTSSDLDDRAISTSEDLGTTLSSPEVSPGLPDVDY